MASLLRPGGNAIGVMLGNGFFWQNIAFGGSLAYGGPRVSLVLSMSYKNGTADWVFTEPGWESNQGPMQIDNVYAGETYNAQTPRHPDLL